MRRGRSCRQKVVTRAQDSLILSLLLWVLSLYPSVHFTEHRRMGSFDHHHSSFVLTNIRRVVCYIIAFRESQSKHVNFPVLLSKYNIAFIELRLPFLFLLLKNVPKVIPVTF